MLEYVFPETVEKHHQKLLTTVASIDIQRLEGTKGLEFVKQSRSNNIDSSIFEDVIDSHEYNHAMDIGIVVKGSGNSESQIKKIVETLNSNFVVKTCPINTYYYYIASLPVCTLVSTNFVDSFVRNRLNSDKNQNIKLSGLQLSFQGSENKSASGLLDQDDTFTLLPSGILVLTCTKDTYESLGLIGYQSKYIKEKYIIEINMHDNQFVPGTKSYKRVQDMFTNKFSNKTIPFIFSITNSVEYLDTIELETTKDLETFTKVILKKCKNKVELSTVYDIINSPLHTGIPVDLKKIIVADDYTLAENKPISNSIPDDKKELNIVDLVEDIDDKSKESDSDVEDEDDDKILNLKSHSANTKTYKDGFSIPEYIPINNKSLNLFKSGLLQIYEWIGLSLLKCNKLFINDSHKDPYIGLYDADPTNIVNELNYNEIDEPVIKSKKNKLYKNKKKDKSKVNNDKAPEHSYLINLSFEGFISPLFVKLIIRKIIELLYITNSNEEHNENNKRTLNSDELNLNQIFISVIGFEDTPIAWNTNKIFNKGLQHQIYSDNGDNGYTILLDTKSNLGILYQGLSAYESYS